MIEKSDGVWKCKICGKTSPHRGNMKHHAETHIEGTSHACHICNKSYPTRNGLSSHISSIPSELLSCDLCGKSGMNKASYYMHKNTKQRITLSGILPQNKHCCSTRWSFIMHTFCLCLCLFVCTFNEISLISLFLTSFTSPFFHPSKTSSQTVEENQGLVCW